MLNKQKFKKQLKGSNIGRGAWHMLHRANITLHRLVPDKQYFDSRYKKAYGEHLDYDDPKTLDAKQLWLKMYYRNPLCVTCSDKYLVRKYVEECGCGNILSTLYGAFDDASSIDWDSLPDQFYLKANNMSGCNVRCNDKNSFDREKAEKYFRKRMKHNYYYETREWNYKDIVPKIIAEEILVPSEPAGLIDYRFLCANGRCDYVYIDIETADENGNHRAEARRNVYDRDMNLIDVQVGRQRFDPELVKKPDNWDEMLACAEKLSGHFPFCRVDLYNLGGRIVFGEITFFHAGGICKYKPEEWAYKLGENVSIDYAKADMNRNYDWSAQAQ